MWTYGKPLWDAMMLTINNEFGVAGLMGNIVAESNIIPYRLQGDYTSNYSKSITYTNQVNTGVYTEHDFVHDAKGYGLCQWTFYSRKQHLYDLKIDGNYDSIGALALAILMINSELNGGYTSTLEALQSAETIRSASDYALHNYFNPADQSESVEIYRAEQGKKVYDLYHGGVTPPPEPKPDPVPGKDFPASTYNIVLYTPYKKY